MLLLYVLVFWPQDMYLASRSGIEPHTPCIGRGTLNRWTTKEAPLMADSSSQPSEGSQHLDLRLPVCETICFCCVSPTSLWPLVAAVLETHSKAPQQLELPPAGQGASSGIPRKRLCKFNPDGACQSARTSRPHSQLPFFLHALAPSILAVPSQSV